MTVTWLPHDPEQFWLRVALQLLKAPQDFLQYLPHLAHRSFMPESERSLEHIVRPCSKRAPCPSKEPQMLNAKLEAWPGRTLLSSSTVLSLTLLKRQMGLDALAK